MIELVHVDDIQPDETNPRKADPNRTHLLLLSLSKLGFILPITATREGLILSGHQRHAAAKTLGFTHVPVQYVDLDERSVKGINILFNRATNDFSALDTGGSVSGRLQLGDIIKEAEALPDVDPDDVFFAANCNYLNIKGLGSSVVEQYDKKAVVIASNMIRKHIHIPIVVSESGQVINGVHRLFAAREEGLDEWPIITIPDEHAQVALHFLNYLSMDYQVDGDFADVLRYSAYRRPQNNRGSVPKAMRFWGNGEKTVPDKDSYSTDYWRNFRDIHGFSVLDFGAGLCKAAPFLATKGIDCLDFEPFRIDPEAGNGVPSPHYSRKKAREFLTKIGDGVIFDSIFLASVMNSIPFPQDRMAVLAIVNALSETNTVVYGTCRDVSDFTYEYGGIRQANYFVFDSEPGVRLGDSLHNPKIQKFHTQEEFVKQAAMLWNKQETWPGGNVFYWRLSYPKRPNPKVLGQALELEFNLPYSGQTRMGLADYAKEMFGKRLGIKIP
jgi:hypothetical protein